MKRRRRKRGRTERKRVIRTEEEEGRAKRWGYEKVKGDGGG